MNSTGMANASETFQFRRVTWAGVGGGWVVLETDADHNLTMRLEQGDLLHGPR